MNSYDKSVPFGIGINGCIDCFSCFIVWMEASTRSNDSEVTLTIIIKELRGWVVVQRGFVQIMAQDRLSPACKCFLGETTRTLLPEVGVLFYFALNPGGNYQENSFWMNTFKALKGNEHFCRAFLDKNLIQFCFLDLIQETERLRCGYINIDTNFTQKQEVKQMLLNCTTCSHFLYQQ